MAVRLEEAERVGLSVVAHAQHVQQCWVNDSHTHFMICAELSKVEKELDHMHTEWTRLAKDNEKMALKLEENGNHGNVMYLLLFSVCTAEEYQNLQQKMGMAQTQCDTQEKELYQLR